MMIVINKATNTMVILTLKEKTTLPNAVYLFEFISNQTRNSQTCIAADISDYPERYNQFEIIERSTTPNGLLAEITLEHEGFWDYKVYAQESSTNLNPDNTYELVETGLAYVIGPDGPIYTYNQQPQNAFVYNG